MGQAFSSSNNKPKTPSSSTPSKWQGVGPNTPLSKSNSSKDNLSLKPSSSAGQLNNAGRRNDKENNKKTNKRAQSAPPTSKKLQKKKIDRSLIGQPSNFQHTGHIGIGDAVSKMADPEKLKKQLSEVAAALTLDSQPVIATVNTMIKPKAESPPPPPPASTAAETATSPPKEPESIPQADNENKTIATSSNKHLDQDEKIPSYIPINDSSNQSKKEDNEDTIPRQSRPSLSQSKTEPLFDTTSETPQGTEVQ